MEQTRHMPEPVAIDQMAFPHDEEHEGTGDTVLATGSFEGRGTNKGNVEQVTQKRPGTRRCGRIYVQVLRATTPRSVVRRGTDPGNQDVYGVDDGDAEDARNAEHAQFLQYIHLSAVEKTW